MAHAGMQARPGPGTCKNEHATGNRSTLRSRGSEAARAFTIAMKGEGQLSTLVIVASVFWDAAAIYPRGNGDAVRWFEDA
jgi:hypothetical protein